MKERLDRLLVIGASPVDLAGDPPSLLSGTTVNDDPAAVHVPHLIFDDEGEAVEDQRDQTESKEEEEVAEKEEEEKEEEDGPESSAAATEAEISTTATETIQTEGATGKQTSSLTALMPAPFATDSSERSRTLGSKKRLGLRTRSESLSKRTKIDSSFVVEYEKNSRMLVDMGMSRERQNGLEKGLEDGEIIKKQRALINSLSRKMPVVPVASSSLSKRGSSSK